MDFFAAYPPHMVLSHALFSNQSWTHIVFIVSWTFFFFQQGGPDWIVELGRKDGVVSSAAEAEALLPSSHSNAATLVASFAALGLTSRDMVTLSGKLWMFTCLILSKQT
jgi:hypothetical protein